MQVLRRFQLTTPLLFIAIGLFLSSPLPLTADASGVTSMSPKERGWLGVSIQEISEGIRQAVGLEAEGGVLVNEVLEGSPAREGGLKAGDVITKFNGTDIDGTSHFIDMVRESKPGEKATLTLLRDGKTMTVDVAIGQRSLRDHPEDLFEEDDFPVLKHTESRPHTYSFHYSPCDRGYIGVRIEDMNDQLAEALGLKEAKGALVMEAEEDSPAYEAGIRGGDVILKIDDEEIADVDDLRSALREKEEGDKVQVTVIRDKKKKDFTVSVDESPDLSSIRKEVEIIDLDDELKDLDALKGEIRSKIEDEVAELKKEVESLKDEFNRWKEEK